MSNIFVIIQKYSKKSGYNNYSIINLCDVGIMVESIEVFKLGLSQSSLTINSSRLKLQCISKNSIPLFDLLVTFYPQPEPDHVAYDIGSSSFEFVKHFIRTRKPTKSALCSILAGAIKKGNYNLVI